jgi:hypothetical protein
MRPAEHDPRDNKTPRAALAAVSPRRIDPPSRTHDQSAPEGRHSLAQGGGPGYAAEM